MTDPSSGDVLACVTYPGYDNNRMANTMDTAYYSKLLIDRSRPLYNHATQEKTAPGSTYKMMTAVAGLEAGMITGDSEIFCEGEFKYVDPNPKCWYYPGAHGWLDCTHAIAASCNCFFYEVGFRFGLNSLDELEDEEHAQYSTDRGIVRLSEYAKDFGFDKNSGLEITEADPEVSDSDSVRSAIGQGTNNYTTSQLARYAAVVASRGKVYDLTLLDKLKDSEGETVTDYKADVINEVSASPKTWDIVQEGMREMIQDSAAFQRIKDLGFSMAGKTGTAQQSDIHPDHVLFVGYAPYDDPQIAFAIRIANGYSSLYTSEVAQDVTRYYFELSDESDILTGQASEVGTVVSGD